MMQLSSNRLLRRGVVAAALAAGFLAFAPMEASAQYYHRRGPSGGAVAAGVLGGLALGALAAAAARPYYDAPRPYYGPAPAYAYEDELPPPPPPRCWFEREDVWNGYGYVPRRIRVCR